MEAYSSKSLNVRNILIILIIFFGFLSCKNVRKIRNENHTSQINEVEKKVKRRLIKCESYSAVVGNHRDLLELDNDLLKCIANSNYTDNNYNVDDLIFILDNTHFGKWKFLFPDHNKFRGKKIFNHFLSKGNSNQSFNSNKQSQNNLKNFKILKYLKAMVKEYRGMKSFGDYLSWFENRDANSKAQSIDWIYYTSELEYDKFRFEELKYHFYLINYAVENGHIVLKDYGEL